MKYDWRKVWLYKRDIFQEEEEFHLLIDLFYWTIEEKMFSLGFRNQNIYKINILPRRSYTENFYIKIHRMQTNSEYFQQFNSVE